MLFADRTSDDIRPTPLISVSQGQSTDSKITNNCLAQHPPRPSRLLREKVVSYLKFYFLLGGGTDFFFKTVAVRRCEGEKCTECGHRWSCVCPCSGTGTTFHFRPTCYYSHTSQNKREKNCLKGNFLPSTERKTLTSEAHGACRLCSYLFRNHGG